MPYYRDLFARARVTPGDVTTLSALSRLPVVTKADLCANFPDRTRWRKGFRLPADGMTRTSGSTGVPFEFYADRAGMDSWLGLALVLPGLARRGALDAADRHLRSARR